ncbi:MAG: hypothetical protein Q9219_004432 [cf. Caloplaca sp. 3 TL-2023]
MRYRMEICREWGWKGLFAYLGLVRGDPLLGGWTKESQFLQVGLECPELERQTGGAGMVAARQRRWKRIRTIAKEPATGALLYLALKSAISSLTPRLMPSDEVAIRQVKLPRHRLRKLALQLRNVHRQPPSPLSSARPIDVVCISDTHGTQPPLPPGDLLLHAGDLTQWGSFSEIQEQLDWLSAQPHKYKVVIAGNHDLLLDSDFLSRHPERWKQAQEASRQTSENDNVKCKDIDDPRTAKDLDWGSIIYLQNTSTTLSFSHYDDRSPRTISIYGSPLTPQYALSAFQYPKGANVWTSNIPKDTDILVTHGPPWSHLDGIKKAGCPFLAKEVARIYPRMVVFGHIHVGYGVEEVVYDTLCRAYEGIYGGWGGWRSLLKMAEAVVWGRVVPQKWRRRVQKTTFVNAAVIEGWKEHKIKNRAVVVTI